MSYDSGIFHAPRSEGPEMIRNHSVVRKSNSVCLLPFDDRIEAISE